MDEIFDFREENGKKILTMAFPPSAAKGSGARLAGEVKAPGYIVSGSDAKEFMFDRTEESDEAVVVFGPAFEGRSLSSFTDEASGLAALGAAAKACAVLAGSGRLPERIYPRGILISEAGEVAVLPQALVERAVRRLSEEKRFAALIPSVSEKMPVQAAAARTLAVNAFSLLLKPDAQVLPAGLPLAEAKKKNLYLPMSAARPELDGELAAAIDAALAAESESSLAEFDEALRKASAKGFFAIGDISRKAELERKGSGIGGRIISANKKNEFLKKRQTLLVASAAAFVLVVAVVWTLVDSALSAPNYSKLPARELVERYYQAIDELDDQSLEACRKGKAGEADINTVLHVSVLSKIRLANEQRNVLVKASEWLAQGKPPFSFIPLVFGITGLNLVDGEAKGSEAKFAADYTLWLNGTSENEKPIVLENIVHDDIILQKTPKNGWKIIDIRRNSTEYKTIIEILNQE